jgi:large subunit ribosomal protein L25
VGDAIHLSQLDLPAGVEVVELMHGPEHDQAVVSIHLPRGAIEAAAEEGGEGGEGEEGAAS